MSQLPSTIKKLFEEIQNEVLGLHEVWQIYRQLFAHSAQRIDLLNESASTFFYIIQEALNDDVQLRLSKLMDPSEISGHRNMSLKALLEAIDDQSLRPTMELILLELEEITKSIRIRRNKEIVHIDYRTRIKCIPIPGVSRLLVENVLELLRKFCNEFEGFYMNSETGYEVITTDDGDHLVSYLKYGLRYAELLNSREIDRSDVKLSKWFEA